MATDRRATYPHISPGALHYSLAMLVLGCLIGTPSAFIKGSPVFSVLFWMGLSLSIAGLLLFTYWFGVNLRARRALPRK